MVITKSFNLDINTPWKAPTLYIKQGDVDSRKLQATIRKDGTNYSIPGDVTATFRMKKPDGTIVTQDATISGSVVSVVMDAQCSTAAGHAFGEIVLATAGEVVSTFLLAIDVMAAAVTDGDIESRDALSEYRGLVDEMLRVKGSPLTANTAAAMTDTDRVYVYTGSEVGYVNGSWYYYDGDSWEVGGVYNSQAISDDFLNEVTQMIKQSAVASESDSTPYLYRPTPNPSAILADEEIVGGTIAWNQLVQEANYVATGGTISTDANYVATFTASASGQQVYRSAGLLKDHVIISAITYKTTTASSDVKARVFARDVDGNASTNWQTIYVMNRQLATGNASIGVVDRRASGWDAINVKNAMFIDLTAALGSTIADYLYTLETGTAGAGVAKFREWGFLSKPYFAYDAGSLKSVNTEGKVVVGVNQWDEEWEDGDISSSTGANTASTSYWRSKNYIPVIPGQSYYIKSSGSGAIRPRYYDQSKNFISTGSISVGNMFTCPANVFFVRFAPSNSNIPNHDISFNTPSTNTAFHHYRSTTYHTTPTDLNGIFKLDANNNLYADGDIYPPSGQIKRRYALVDLGTLSWYAVSEYTDRFYSSTIQSMIKAPASVSTAGNIFCKQYVTIAQTDASASTDKSIYLSYPSGLLYAIDSAYSTAAAFKTAMNGVYAVYELATPTTETADPYTATQIVGKGGTEEWIDNRSVPVPVGHNTTYAIGVPDVPASGSNLVLKATASGGKTTLKWE